MRRRIVMMGLVVMGGLVPPWTSAFAQTIKVGVAVSLTGRFAMEGKLVYDGNKLWMEEVNKRGGINVGGTRMKVDLVSYDDKGETQTAVDLTEKLITQDKVRFLFSPFSSVITQQTSVVNEKYKVLTIAPVGASDTIYERGFKYIFSILPPSSAYFHRVLDMGAELRDRPKTLAILAGNQQFTLIVGKGAEDYARRLGYDVVYNEKFPTPATDLSVFLAQIKAKNADMVLVASYFQEALLASKQAKELKVCPKLLAFSVGPEIPDFAQQLGKDAEYLVGSAWWLPNMGWKGPDFGSSQDYARLVKEKYGSVAGYHVASGTAAGHLLQLAIEKAGSLETDKVRAALLSIDQETFWGPTKWNEQGKNVKGGQGVIQIQDANITTVYPGRIREKALVYPMPCWDKR